MQTNLSAKFNHILCGANDVTDTLAREGNAIKFLVFDFYSVVIL